MESIICIQCRDQCNNSTRISTLSTRQEWTTYWDLDFYSIAYAWVYGGSGGGQHYLLDHQFGYRIPSADAFDVCCDVDAQDSCSIRDSAAAAAVDASVATIVRKECSAACAAEIPVCHQIPHWPADATFCVAAFGGVVDDEYSSHDIRAVIAADGCDI